MSDVEELEGECFECETEVCPECDECECGNGCVCPD